MEERHDGRREDGGQEEGKGEKQWSVTSGQWIVRKEGRMRFLSIKCVNRSTERTVRAIEIPTR